MIAIDSNWQQLDGSNWQQSSLGNTWQQLAATRSNKQELASILSYWHLLAECGSK